MKQSLILTNANDHSSSVVIKWLLYFNKAFTRINNGDTLDVKAMTFENKKFKLQFVHEGVWLNLDDFQSYWYRRGNFSIANLPNYNSQDEVLQKKINAHLLKERKSLNHFIHKLFESRKNISSISNASVNKLEVLRLASLLGLDIPDTYLLSEKKDVNILFNQNKSLITKGIQEGLIFQHKSEADTKEIQYAAYTSAFKKTQLVGVQKKFAITKFQTKIDKAVELRIFLLNNKFYTMAIFSQNNPKTKVDFRNYDFKHPNRSVPFILPKKIEKKLLGLFEKLNLNSGSADMIINQAGQYIFLEINPIGQFGMVSSPCNYYLEKEIAAFL
jgi:ATP-GRASP peptide maturase of grasp-with-spasm system